MVTSAISLHSWRICTTDVLKKQNAKEKRIYARDENMEVIFGNSVLFLESLTIAAPVAFGLLELAIFEGIDWGIL
jgi:ribosomal protein S17